RDQSAGVADADPEDEIGDIPCPKNRVVVPPHADASRNLIGEHSEQHESDAGAHGDGHVPAPRRLRLGDITHLIRQIVISRIACNERRIYFEHFAFENRCLNHLLTPWFLLFAGWDWSVLPNTWCGDAHPDRPAAHSRVPAFSAWPHGL